MKKLIRIKFQTSVASIAKLELYEWDRTDGADFPFDLRGERVEAIYSTLGFLVTVLSSKIVIKILDNRFSFRTKLGTITGMWKGEEGILPLGSELSLRVVQALFRCKQPKILSRKDLNAFSRERDQIVLLEKLKGLSVVLVGDLRSWKDAQKLLGNRKNPTGVLQDLNTQQVNLDPTVMASLGNKIQAMYDKAKVT